MNDTDYKAGKDLQNIIDLLRNTQNCILDRHIQVLLPDLKLIQGKLNEFIKDVEKLV